MPNNVVGAVLVGGARNNLSGKTRKKVPAVAPRLAMNGSVARVVHINLNLASITPEKV